MTNIYIKKISNGRFYSFKANKAKIFQAPADYEMPVKMGLNLKTKRIVDVNNLKAQLSSGKVDVDDVVLPKGYVITPLSRKILKTNKAVRNVIEKENKELEKRLNGKRIVYYANYAITKPRSIEPEQSREAIHTDTYFKGYNIKEKVIELTNKFDVEHEDYYSREIKQFKKITYKISNFIPEAKVEMMNRIMKASITCRRDFCRYMHAVSEKSFTDMKNECVYELLAELLKPRMKTISKENLFNEFKKYNDQKLDYDCEKYINDFDIKSGVSTDLLTEYCQRHRISLYALDVNDNVFHRVSDSSGNHRPICYYLIDDHMYLINDTTAIKSISQLDNGNDKVVVSSILNAMKDRNIDEKSTFDEVEISERATFDEALTVEKGIVYIPKSNMTEEAIKCMLQQDDNKCIRIHLVKTKGHHIIWMQIKRKGGNLTIICDPKYTEDDGISWKQIKAICDKFSIPFRNQTIGTLLTTIQSKFFNLERAFLTCEQKDEVLTRQHNKCNLKECRKKLKGIPYEFDHIVNLASGGSNNINNFQALCKDCHLNKTAGERENSDFIKYDNLASILNNDVQKLLHNNDLFGHWAFVDKLVKVTEDDLKSGNVFKLDHVKCRRNIVLHSDYAFPIFSVMDEVETFNVNDDIKVGYYYVESKNYFPLRGNGFYNYVLINFCLENGIIQKSDIKHKLCASYSVNGKYFNDLIYTLLSVCKDMPSVQKAVVNALVGCWGIKRNKIEKCLFTMDRHEATEKYSFGNNAFIDKHKIDDETSLFAVYEDIELVVDETFVPFYHQVCAIEAIELYKLEQMIKSFGFEVLERNTDAILYRGEKINVDSYFWDYENTVTKYRYDKLNPLKVDSVCNITRNSVFEYKPKQFEFIAETETVVSDVVSSGLGCLIDGQAGTGKTYTLNKIIAELEQQNKKVIKLSPTNKASLLINGETIHKFALSLMLSRAGRSKIIEELKNVDYIIVDEISMVKEVFYRLFTLIKRYVPTVKFIIAGDFKQLAPVNDRYTGTYKDRFCLASLCDFKKLVLTTCRRSDRELFNLYQTENIPNIDKLQHPKTELTKLNIAYTHKTRKSINEKCMQAFKPLHYSKMIKASANKHNAKTQDSILYAGLPIVSHCNNEEHGIWNTEIYEISSINYNRNKFTFTNSDGVTVELSSSEFSSHFYPGYCITAHVSQGCTFTDKYTIYDWRKMDNRLKYVALSRATSISNIQIA